MNLEQLQPNATIRGIITMARNEILYSLNKPEDFISLSSSFWTMMRTRVHYLCQPFTPGADSALPA
jgi:hypothetical protein